MTATGPAGAVTRPRESTCEGWSTRPSARPQRYTGRRVGCGRATHFGAQGRHFAWPAEARQQAGEFIELELDSTGRLAREIAGHGADALVIEPQELRDDVCAHAWPAHAESAMTAVSATPGAAAELGAVLPANPRISYEDAASDLGASARSSCATT